MSLPTAASSDGSCVKKKNPSIDDLSSLLQESLIIQSNLDRPENHVVKDEFRGGSCVVRSSPIAIRKKVGLSGYGNSISHSFQDYFIDRIISKLSGSYDQCKERDPHISYIRENPNLEDSQPTSDGNVRPPTCTTPSLHHDPEDHKNTDSKGEPQLRCKSDSIPIPLNVASFVGPVVSVSPVDPNWGSIPESLTPKYRACPQIYAVDSDQMRVWEKKNPCWEGKLIEHKDNQVLYSSKVFLGGTPWDITEYELIKNMKPFGRVTVEWPEKPSRPKTKVLGYAYVILESGKHVKRLINACVKEEDGYYFKLSSRKIASKRVQVIPWMINNMHCPSHGSYQGDRSQAIFVGGLHGMTTAQTLFYAFNDMFGGVVYAGIDVDKYKYPIGSGRVVFNNHRSYMKANASFFVEMKTNKFSKTVQIDPYLEASVCFPCGHNDAPYFCRDLICFKYFCESCWMWQHSLESLKHHLPLVRNMRV